MIKVIKHGKYRKFRATCPRCEAVFEFEKTDIEDARGRKYIHCPDCNECLYEGQWHDISDNENHDYSCINIVV